MKYSILLLISLLFCVGFSIETPESLEEERLRRENWHLELDKAYDFEALRKFLVSLIDEIQEVNGVRLEEAKIEGVWESGPYGRTCGDWYFWADSRKIDSFHISWIYASHETEYQSTLQETIRFYCVRISKSKFRLIRAAKEKDEIVELNP
jgi:hypothetical protein